MVETVECALVWIESDASEQIFRRSFLNDDLDVMKTAAKFLRQRFQNAGKFFLNRLMVQ